MNRGSVLRYSAFLFFTFCSFSSGQGVNWKKDFEAARKEAIAENRLMLLHFSADWCRPCKELEKFVFNSVRVSSAIESQLIPVHINTDNRPDLVKQYAIAEIPADVVITPEGRVVTKRKSPKTADDYIRMVKNLPSGSVANQQANLELTQKIDQVIAASTTQKVTPKSNDFVPSGVEIQKPEYSSESAKLLEDSNARARLVMHEATQKEDKKPMEAPLQPNRQVAKNSASTSKRIFNDTFFSEKSDRENGSSNRPQSTQPQTNQFVGNSQDVSGDDQGLNRAKINNPFEKSTGNQFSNAGTAAKILAANSDVVKSDRTSLPGVSTNESAFQVPNDQLAKPNLLTPMKKADTARPAAQFAKSAPVAPVAASKPMAVAAAKQMDQKAARIVVTEEPKFALEGKCPVTLISDGKWVAGDEKFGCVHRGRTYVFADAEKLKMFQDDPEAFSPVLAGYDPVMFHDRGEMVDGNAKHGVFMGKSPNHRIILFSTKETRSKFQSDPQKFMATIRMATQQAGNKMR